METMDKGQLCEIIKYSPNIEAREQAADQLLDCGQAKRSELMLITERVPSRAKTAAQKLLKLGYPREAHRQTISEILPNIAFI